ncbi:hypothetical protein Hanom_Chr04g00283331 [Helianthus anomalus]
MIYKLILLLLIKSSQYRTRIETYKGAEGEPAVVDRVALCSDKKQNLIVKFMIRHTRRPEVQVYDFMMYNII